VETTQFLSGDAIIIYLYNNYEQVIGLFAFFLF